MAASSSLKRAIMELGVPLDHDYVVFPSLERLAPENPHEAVEVLRLLLTTAEDEYIVHGSVDETRAVLEAAIGSDDQDAREEARALAHLLGARGMREFRDLAE